MKKLLILGLITFLFVSFDISETFAQKITEKTFFKNQQQYITQVKVGEITIRQKRIPKSVFPAKITPKNWSFYNGLEGIQNELDKLQADFVAKKKESYTWKETYRLENKTFSKRLKELQEEDNRLKVESYAQEWEVYATYFRQQDSISSAQFWQKYNAEKQAVQEQYYKLLKICEKDILTFIDLEHLKTGRQIFPDSVALRECYVLKLAQSGEVKLALQEQEPYLQTGSGAAQEKSLLFYNRIKKDYIKVQTPTNTTNINNTRTKTTTTRRIKTTGRRR